MSKLVYQVKDNYELKFGGDSFKATLEWVKQLPKSRYDPSAKRWVVPVSEESTRALRGARWHFIGDASIKKMDLTKQKSFPDLKPVELKSYDDSGYVLAKFQNEAVSFGISRNDNWLLALPMGSGKGCVASAWLGLRGRKVLVVCPASMKVAWQRELKRWADMDSVILEGKYPADIDFSSTDAFIINYEILPDWFPSLRRKPKYIAVDECQRISNPTAIQTKKTITLCREAEGKVFISGTPAKDRPRQLFTVLNLIDPIMFPDRQAFYNRYCDPKPGFKGVITYDGATNREELHGLLQNYMFRRTKEEILPDLPLKNKIVFLIGTNQSKGYISAEKRLLASIEAQDKKKQKEAIADTYLEAYLMKREILWEKIDQWLEENPDEKLVIAAYHTIPVQEIFERYKKIAVCVSGATLTKDRQGLVDQFQEDKKTRIFVGQMLAAGVGLTLTAARTMMFAELWYVPSDLAQMEDRIHRYTSTGDSVEYIYMVAAKTIEEKMMKMVDKKSSWMGAIMDGKEATYFNEDEIFDMLLED